MKKHRNLRLQLAHLSVCLVAGLGLASCAPFSKDRFYRETSAQATNANAKAADIVGEWYDAWYWAGHEMSVLTRLHADGTGTELRVTRWRRGGGLKKLADVKWSYNGDGTWSVTVSNPRTLAGSGRFSSKPYTYTARVMGRRYYHDLHKRTWVNTKDSEAVADKNLDVEWTGEAERGNRQQIMELGQAIDNFRAAL